MAARKIGQAWVEIIPKVNRFARDAERQVERGLDRAFKGMGQKAGQAFNTSFGRQIRTGLARDTGNISQTLVNPFRRGGLQSARAFGQSFSRRMTIEGRDGGKKFLGVLGDTVSLHLGPFTSGISTRVAHLMVNAFIAAAVVATPFLVGILSAGLTLGISGVVVAAAIAAAAKHPAVQKAWDRLGKTAKTVFDRIGKIVAPSVAKALDVFNAGLKTATPILERMAKATRPIIDKLAPAFLSMALNALPGIEQALKNSQPYWDALAAAAPELGAAIGDFFAIISDKKNKGALEAFKDLLKVLPGFIRGLANLIVDISNAYSENKDEIKALIADLTELWHTVLKPMGKWLIENGPAMAGAIAAFLTKLAELREALHAEAGKPEEQGLAGVWHRQMEFMTIRMEQFKGIWDSFWKTSLPQSVMSGFASLGVNINFGIQTALANLGSIATLGGPLLATTFSLLKPYVDQGLQAGILGPIGLVPTQVAGIFASLALVVQRYVSSAMNLAVIGVQIGVGRIAAAAALLINLVPAPFRQAFELARQQVGSVMALLVVNVGTLPGRIGAALMALGGILLRLFQSAFQTAVDVAMGILGRWLGQIRSSIGRIPGILSSGLAGLGGIVAVAFGRMVVAAATQGGRILSYTRSLPAAIVGTLAGLAGMLYQAGVNALAGLAQGIRDAGGRAIEEARRIASSVAGAVAGFFLNRSPSKLMRQHGEWVMEGFQQGLERGAPDVNALLRALVPAGSSTPSDAGRHARDQDRLLRQLIDAVGRVAPDMAEELVGISINTRNLARTM